jgi:hypothetical protein
LKNKLKATFEIEKCWFFAVLWRPFWKWRPVEIVQCQESIQDLETEQCWICVVLCWPFWKWRLAEIFRCQESFRDIIIYPHMKCRWNRTMLNLCGIVAAIFKKGDRKFLPVAIFKMATTILHNFNIVRFQRHFIYG